MLLLLLPWACLSATPEQAVLACGDATCRAGVVTAAWSEGDAPGAVALGAVTDPAERELLALALARATPDRAEVLCALLSGEGRLRCEKVVARPHLSTQPDVSSKERSERYFRDAEALVESGGAAAYAEAMKLCAQSGSFQGNCNDHLIARLAQDAPPATAGTAAWQGQREAAAAISAAWKAEDPTHGAWVVGQLWSYATWQAAQSAALLTGDGFDSLPAEAWPHLRAAVVAVMMRRVGGREPTLEGWVARVNRALLARQPSEEAGSTPPLFQPVEDRWGRDPTPPQGRVAIPYLGTSRRLVSDDAEADLVICILEAGARWAGPTSAAYLWEVRKHMDPAVRATVERLSGKEG